jgi:hypothetical protein
MLSLISEQAIPNVMAPLLVKPRPSRMVCLLPADRDALDRLDREFERVFEGIQAAFGLLAEDSEGEIDLRLHKRGPVSPYGFEEVQAACREIRTGFVSQGYEVIYNVTGGTKLMAQAALEDAREGGCQAVYVDTEFRKVVQVEPEADRTDFVEERLRSVDVPHYLAAYGLGRQRSLGHRKIPEAFGEAARLLAENPASSPSILQLILRETPSKYGRPTRQLGSLAPQERQVLERIVEVLTRGGADISISDDTLTIAADDDMYDFWWNRRWLEWYVFSVIEDLNKNSDKELNYNRPWWDVRFVWDTDDVRKLMDHLLTVEYEDERGTVRTELPLNELDVAAVRGGRLLLCECKTGKRALESEHFYKLHVLGRRLGTFADQMFITDVSGLDDLACEEAKVRRQAVRALTLDVAVVGLERLRELRSILPEPDRFLREQKADFGLR